MQLGTEGYCQWLRDNCGVRDFDYESFSGVSLHYCVKDEKPAFNEATFSFHNLRYWTLENGLSLAHLLEALPAWTEEAVLEFPRPLQYTPSDYVLLIHVFHESLDVRQPLLSLSLEGNQIPSFFRDGTLEWQVDTLHLGDTEHVLLHISLLLKPINRLAILNDDSKIFLTDYLGLFPLDTLGYARRLGEALGLERDGLEWMDKPCYTFEIDGEYLRIFFWNRPTLSERIHENVHGITFAHLLEALQHFSDDFYA